MALGRARLPGVLMWHAGAESDASKEDTLRAGSAVVCPQRSGERVSMHSTDRLPEASGTIHVECGGGTTLLDLEVDWMKPALLFGGDYNTYALWVVPPRGAAENFGEIPLEGNRGRLRLSTRVTRQSAAPVTVEPHFFVSTPSSFVVLENKPAAHAPLFHYAVLEGVYNFERSTIHAQARETARLHVAAQHLATDRELQDRPIAKEGSGGGKKAEP